MGELIFGGRFAFAKCMPYDVKTIILGQVLGFLLKNLRRMQTLHKGNQKMSQSTSKQTKQLVV